MKPLRILLLNSARPWIGEAAHTLALAQGLSARGHRVIVGVRAGHELERRAQEAGLETLSLHLNSRFHIRKDPADWRRVRRLLREERIQVVHCHRGKDHWLAAAALILGFPGVPLVRTRHVVMPARLHSLNRWLYASRTQGLISVSRAARASLGPLVDRMAAGCEKVVYASVDAETFSPERRSQALRRRWGIRDGDLLVGLIGRLEHVKGHRLFLEAAAEVARSHPNAHFLLAGRGEAEEAAALRAHAEAAGLPPDRLRIEGELPDIAEAIASLDIGVIASLGSEGSSRVGLEYMASGLAIVATRVGGVPELIRDGEDGCLLDANDRPAMVHHLTRLAADPDLRGRLGKTARQAAIDRYSPDRWLTDTEGLYRTVLDQAR